MDTSLILRSLYALFIIGILLFVLWYMARFTGRSRIVGFSKQRLITVLETAFLSQQSTVHVVKAGSKYLLVGSGGSGLSLLAELNEAEVETWMDEQRRLLSDQTASFGEFYRRLRGR